MQPATIKERPKNSIVRPGLMNSRRPVPENLPEFDNHESVSFLEDKASGLNGFIAIHRGNVTFPSFGATRFWRYSFPAEGLNDALRLSRMMSYKVALAGLPYGGAKGVIMSPKQSITAKAKGKILKSYADQVNYLAGRFITGTDVGINQDELMVMAKYSPFMVGLRSNPTKFTALGLFSAIKVCLEKVFGNNQIQEHSFAIQGMGKIGEALADLLYREGARLLVTDINKERLRFIKKKYPRIEIIHPSEIHIQKTDCFCPCALSGSLNKETVSQLQCKIVAGGANNQLENNSVGYLLHKKGILYAPDYLVNAGGLISVVDEYENKVFDENRIEQKVDIISKNLKAILEVESQQNRPPFEIANEMAEKVFNGYRR